MAAEHHKPFILFRPGFILLCLYVAAYAWLRSADQIVEQTAFPSMARGGGMTWTIMPEAGLPHWRRQLWRALFSLPMVVEEEGRRHEKSLRELYEGAKDTVGRNEPEPLVERIPIRQEEIQYRQQQQEQQIRQQQRQQQYQQQQQQAYEMRQREYSLRAQPQQQAYQQTRQQPYPPLNEGERLIYMPTPEEQSQQQLLYRSTQ